FTKIFQIVRPNKRSYCVENNINAQNVNIIIVNTDSSPANEQFELFRSKNPTIALVTVGSNQSPHHISGMLLPSRVYKVMDEVDVARIETKTDPAQTPNNVTQSGLQQPVAQPTTPEVAESVVVTPKIASTPEIASPNVSPQVTKVVNEDKVDLAPIKTKKEPAPTPNGGPQSGLQQPVAQHTAPEVVTPKTSETTETTSPKVSSEITQEPEYQVLVVDDSELMQQAVLVELKKVDRVLNIDFASSGEEGMQRIDEKKYDVIFMDVMMPKPGMDGFEACTKIRKIPEMKKTPIIMLTSKTSPLDEVKGVMAGCSTYLTKPIKQDNFQAVMKRVLGWLEKFQNANKNSSHSQTSNS
ncbi:MAG: response regulator, partial [Thiotrichaceae bacterium]